MKNKPLLLSITLLVSACAVSRVDPMSVPLSYSPDKAHTQSIGPLSCNTVALVDVSDARADKATLGTRTHESLPLKAEVTTASNVASWVESGLHAMLSQNGITHGDGPKLVVSLDSLRTSESIWHRSSYEAHITLTGRLENSAGKVCWSETVQGAGGNYGYSGSEVNYQETLNRALDAADLNLLKQQSFKEALCSCGS